MSNVYRFVGSIKDAINDGNVTTKIILSDNTQMLVPDDMGNGMVFDINPSTGTTIKLNGVEYQKGNNVAWVKPEIGNGYFDELGMNIDISEIAQLRQDVDNIKEQLDSYYKTEIINSSWTSAQIPKGIYQFSSVFGPASGKVLSVFILSFDNNGSSLTETPVDISGNFNTYWEIDVNDTGCLKPKTFTGTRNLSIHKIGES